MRAYVRARACDHRVHTRLQYMTIVTCVRCGWLSVVFLLQTLSVAALHSCNCRKQTLLPVSWAVSPTPCASHMTRGPLCILTLAARCKQGETAHLRLLTSDYLLVLSEFPFMGELVDYKNARFTTCKIGYVMNLLTWVLTGLALLCTVHMQMPTLSYRNKWCNHWLTHWWAIALYVIPVVLLRSPPPTS